MPTYPIAPPDLTVVYALMFLRCKKRRKDGKEHHDWSIVENRRVMGGRVLQRHVFYLGELNGSQEASWRRTVELFGQDSSTPQQASLFPETHLPETDDPAIPNIGIRLSHMRLEHPRQWGACWLGCELWQQLGLDKFWLDKLPPGRQGTRWDQIVQTLVLYRLIDPGSEWRLHRHWFDHSALADLLGGDFSLAEIHRLYECHDKILEHKTALFDHLNERWHILFDAKFEILLYDLTSTYFEIDPTEDPADMRRFGYSRDKRSDCVQVVIALIVTPEGFPIAYEVLPGNTLDKTTLAGFLRKIEAQYGKADRIWIMDRGIPTEETMQQMRESAPNSHTQLPARPSQTACSEASGRPISASHQHDRHGSAPQAGNPPSHAASPRRCLSQGFSRSFSRGDGRPHRHGLEWAHVKPCPITPHSRHHTECFEARNRTL